MTLPACAQPGKTMAALDAVSAMNCRRVRFAVMGSGYCKNRFIPRR
jgi:hypothetical protein